MLRVTGKGGEGPKGGPRHRRRPRRGGGALLPGAANSLTASEKLKPSLLALGKGVEDGGWKYGLWVKYYGWLCLTMVN